MRRPPGRSVLIALGAGWLLAGGFACASSATSGDKAQSLEPGAPVRLAPTPSRQDSLEPGSLTTVRGIPVEGWSGPGGRPFEVAVRTRDLESGHARRFGVLTRRITLRGSATDLVQYPCTSCHLGRTVAMKPARIGDAHQNIQPQHPALLKAACSTCHSPDAVDQLALRTGERVGLDHSYRLCSQCHFAQAENWASGAHGKRLDGWQGRRVVMGCSECHDPHRPATVSRIPFRAPTILRNGAGGRN